jgi:hypothetical protein
MSRHEPLSQYNSPQLRSESGLTPAALCLFLSCSQWLPSSNWEANVSSSHAVRRRAMGMPYLKVVAGAGHATRRALHRHTVGCGTQRGRKAGIWQHSGRRVLL